MTFNTSEYSSEIKNEVLQIIEAFNLGGFKGLISFTPSENLDDYILTEFKTEKGIYNHWFRIKN